MDSLLHCPHDLSKSREFRDDLPVLLSSEKAQEETVQTASKCGLLEKETRISAFGSQKSDTKLQVKKFNKNCKNIKMCF